MNQDPLIQNRATINPYLAAGGLVLSRLAWDLDYRAWIARSRLRRLRDSQVGKKAVVVCNGPSIKDTDWRLLEGVHTFGLNKINLLFENVDFRPSCIVSVNPHVLGQNAEFFRTTRIPLFLDRRALRAGIAVNENVHLLHSCNINKFARDCSISVFEGGTVTYVALQLAFHMGFSEVALIGCDHNYSSRGAPNQLDRKQGPDVDHFHPEYFADGTLWNLPDLELSEASYRLAARVFGAFGRRIVNAGSGGNLEIFPRMSLEEFVGGGT